ncbi:MAG: hypothetical protein ACR2QO_14525 [Acidimicrobiales bacterium]
MTYRDALQQVAQGTDPATAFADFELEGVSPDALSSALRHFAETSPLEVADLLSPFLARTSPVPFEADDLESLPEADAILADGGGISELLTEIGLDPTTLDVGDTIDAAEEALVDAAEEIASEQSASEDSAPETGDDTFGSGGQQADEADAIEVLEQIGRVDEEANPAIEEVDDGLGVDTETFTELLDEFDRFGTSDAGDDLEDVPDDFDME